MAIPGLVSCKFSNARWETNSAKDIPREGMAHHEVSVNAQLLTKLANLVLEELSKRLNEFQLRRRISKSAIKG